MTAPLSDETVNKEVRAKWIAALRSGRYAQGTGTLRKHDKFCCLGVLCDVIDSESWQDMSGGNYWQRNHGGENLLPTHIEELTGITRDLQWALADMNDLGASFAAIADHIEANI